MNAKSQAGNKFAVVQIAAACVLVISFYLPWISASFGGYGISVSMSWVDYVTTAGSPWAQDIQSLLIVFGAFAALVCAFFVSVRGRRTPAFLRLTLLSFVAAAVGSLWFFLQFNQTIGLESSSGVSVGLGLWVYIAAALVGVFASFRLLNPAGVPAPTSFAPPFAPAPGPTGTYVAPPPPWSTPPMAPPPPPWAQPMSTPPAPSLIPPTPDVSAAETPAAYAATPAKAKTCSNCSETVEASARFCQFCGFDLSKGS